MSLLQCLTWNRVLPRLDRNDATVWRLRSSPIVLHGFVYLLHIRCTAAVYRWSHWTYHSSEQDHLRHYRKTAGCSQLSAVCWLGLSMGCNLTLDYSYIELYVCSFNLHATMFTVSFLGCNFLKYVTLFSCDTFGFYVSWVYLQYGVQVITRQFPNPSNANASESPAPTLDGAFVGIILALLMLVTSYLFRTASRSALFHQHVRRFLADYGMPISLVAASAMAFWGRFNGANPTTLPTGRAFMPAGNREWLVKFWQLDGKWVGIAFPFGFALWVLFFFDHNVSVGSCNPNILRCFVIDSSRLSH